jgi:hypothetical protein
MMPIWIWTGRPATRESVQSQVCRGWRALVGKLYDDLLAAGWDGRLYQVKEKIAMLRFYIEGSTPELRALINEAMTESGRTCEVCGGPGEGISREWWRNTLCAPHASDPRPAWEQADELDGVKR